MRGMSLGSDCMVAHNFAFLATAAGLFETENLANMQLRAKIDYPCVRPVLQRALQVFYSDVYSLQSIHY